MVFGRKSGLSTELITLSAVGNAICGSSAIAAAAPVIQAKEKDMGVSVALVNGMGSIWMFIFPILLINMNGLMFMLHLNLLEQPYRR